MKYLEYNLNILKKSNEIIASFISFYSEMGNSSSGLELTPELTLFSLGVGVELEWSWSGILKIGMELEWSGVYLRWSWSGVGAEFSK